MILLKVNRTAAKENAVFISELQDPILDQSPGTLTKYSVAFTNTTDVSTVTIGGTVYTLSAVADAGEVIGADSVVREIEEILDELGYAWDAEHCVHYEIDGTTTTFYTDFSQVVFDDINATAWVAGTGADVTVYGLS